MSQALEAATYLLGFLAGICAVLLGGLRFTRGQREKYPALKKLDGKQLYLLCAFFVFLAASSGAGVWRSLLPPSETTVIIKLPEGTELSGYRLNSQSPTRTPPDPVSGCTLVDSMSAPVQVILTNTNTHLIAWLEVQANAPSSILVEASGFIDWRNYVGNSWYQVGISRASGKFDFDQVIVGGFPDKSFEPFRYQQPFTLSRSFDVSVGDYTFFLNATRGPDSGGDPALHLTSLTATACRKKS